MTAIATNPAARPSKPSVRFTALLTPVSTNVTQGTYIACSTVASHGRLLAMGTINTYLKKGSVVEAPGNEDSGYRQRITQNDPTGHLPCQLVASTSPSFFTPARFCWSLR